MYRYEVWPTSDGWGYTIFDNDVAWIVQPHDPALSGFVSMTQERADEAAQEIVAMIQERAEEAAQES